MRIAEGEEEAMCEGDESRLKRSNKKEREKNGETREVKLRCVYPLMIDDGERIGKRKALKSTLGPDGMGLRTAVNCT